MRPSILHRILILRRIAGYGLGGDRDAITNWAGRRTSRETPHPGPSPATALQLFRDGQAPSEGGNGGLLAWQSHPGVIQCLCELQHGAFPFARDRGLTLSQYEAIAHWGRDNCTS